MQLTCPFFADDTGLGGSLNEAGKQLQVAFGDVGQFRGLLGQRSERGDAFGGLLWAGYGRVRP